MIKSILIKAVIEGCGIVNFDSNEQKYTWNRQRNVENVQHKNVSFGKARYYEEETVTENGKIYLTRVGIISADCIRHTMYEDCMSNHLPNIMHDDGLLLNTAAHPALLGRGYLFPRDGKTTWKRNSAFALSYAKAISNSIPILETFSSSQPKTGENKTEGTAETSFFKREVRGDTSYELSGSIDVGELAFISLSDVHDRLSFDADYSTKYRELLKNRIGSDVSEPAFFQKNGDIYDIPEHGILLTQAQVKIITLDILKRLALFNISRTVTGHAKTVSVNIKFVSDPLEDFFEDPNGWIEIFNGRKFQANIFDTAQFVTNYTKVNLQEEAKLKIEKYKKKFGYVKQDKEKKEEKKEKKDKKSKTIVSTED
jgi:hypothetical protein